MNRRVLGIDVASSSWAANGSAVLEVDERRGLRVEGYIWDVGIAP